VFLNFMLTNSSKGLGSSETADLYYCFGLSDFTDTELAKHGFFFRHCRTTMKSDGQKGSGGSGP
jgi:hypothetical protein